MENKETIEPVSQVVKSMDVSRMSPGPVGDVIFVVDVRMLDDEEAGDGYSGGMDMKVVASPDLLADDVMGRRLRAALRLALESYLTSHPAENDNVNQTIELDG